MAHPNWSMGAKITIDSATLMNKGLEVIEAHWLFNLPADKIDVIVHPQSIVHSIVQFEDGSMKAQMGLPDMKLPIALALGWPSRVSGAAMACDFTTASTWEFAPLDAEVFPAVELAREGLSIAEVSYENGVITATDVLGEKPTREIAQHRQHCEPEGVQPFFGGNEQRPAL